MYIRLYIGMSSSRLKLHLMLLPTKQSAHNPNFKPHLCLLIFIFRMPSRHRSQGDTWPTLTERTLSRRAQHLSYPRVTLMKKINRQTCLASSRNFVISRHILQRNGTPKIKTLSIFIYIYISWIELMPLCAPPYASNDAWTSSTHHEQHVCVLPCIYIYI